MYNSYNPEATDKETSLKLFKNFLTAEKIAKGSIRSYLSDIRFFFSWLEIFCKENHLTATGLQQNLSLITEKVLAAYKTSLLDQETPIKTINRRFSSLRKFGAFCQTQGWLLKASLNPFDALRNISQDSQKRAEEPYRLGEFRVYLWQNKASQSTIKNYLSDVRQFIQWSERKMIPLAQR